MMKGTPCSRGNYAPLKTSSKTRISIEVQGLGPWRGLGQRPNLACFIGQWFGCWVCPTHNTNPAKRVRAWVESGHGLSTVASGFTQGTVRTCARLSYSTPPLCARLVLPGLGERERSRDLGLAASACCHLPPSGG